MAINNHKPIGSNIRHDTSKQVGGTYGERRQFESTRNTIQEPQIYRPRDSFGTNERVTFGPGQYLGTKKVLPHKLIEAGKTAKRLKPSDELAISFLDVLISGKVSKPAENVSPQVIKQKMPNQPSLIKIPGKISNKIR